MSALSPTAARRSTLVDVLLRLLARLPRRRRRVPVRLQMTDVECGVTCLAMVLAYFGRGVSVGEMAANAGSGRDGITAASLVKIAAAHAFACAHSRSPPSASPGRRFPRSPIGRTITLS